MKDCINIGLLGVGTVGSGVLHVLEHNGGEIAKKAGCKIEIKKILVRNPQKAAELGKKYAVTGDFEDIVNDPDIDIVVELIGREHPAKEYIASALEHGKNVVTANKDVLAKYGRELFPLSCFRWRSCTMLILCLKAPWAAAYPLSARLNRAWLPTALNR